MTSIDTDTLLAAAYALRAAEAKPVNDMLKASGKPPLTHEQIMMGYWVLLSVDLAEGLDISVNSRWQVVPELERGTVVVLFDEARKLAGGE